LNSTAPVGKNFQDIDSSLMENFARLAKQLNNEYSRPPLRNYSMKATASIQSLISDFGGIRGVIDAPDAVKVIADAVGEFH
jgi:hypothetical protein